MTIDWNRAAKLAGVMMTSDQAGEVMAARGKLLACLGGNPHALLDRMRQGPADPSPIFGSRPQGPSANPFGGMNNLNDIMEEMIRSAQEQERAAAQRRAWAAQQNAKQSAPKVETGRWLEGDRWVCAGRVEAVTSKAALIAFEGRLVPVWIPLSAILVPQTVLASTRHNFTLAGFIVRKKELA